MRRREKFIISSVVLAAGLYVVQFVPLEYRLLAFFVFFIFSYLVSVWALYEDLYGVEWITIVPLPAMYGVAVGLFNFLLPDNVASKIFILALFGIGMYALYLTANIYSVAKIRTIQLLRAAHTIGLFFTLLTSTLLTNFVLSLHLQFWANGILIYLIHFPLILMSLWSVGLQPRIEARIWLSAGIFALIISELAIVFSFLPLQVLTSSVIIASVFYVLLGILHNYLQERLFRNTILEYLTFSALLFVYFFLNLPWK